VTRRGERETGAGVDVYETANLTKPATTNELVVISLSGLAQAQFHDNWFFSRQNDELLF